MTTIEARCVSYWSLDHREVFQCVELKNVNSDEYILCNEELSDWEIRRLWVNLIVEYHATAKEKHSTTEPSPNFIKIENYLLEVPMSLQAFYLKLKEEAKEPDGEELQYALEEAVRLNTHYARLLNGWDDGERLEFDGVGEWMKRLREIGRLPIRKEHE